MRRRYLLFKLIATIIVLTACGENGTHLFHRLPRQRLCLALNCGLGREFASTMDWRDIQAPLRIPQRFN